MFQRQAGKGVDADNYVVISRDMGYVRTYF
jgi:hypothetical protein